MKVSKVQYKKVEIVRYDSYTTVGGVNKIYTNKFGFDKILLEKITKQNLYDIVNRKGLKVAWLKKLEILNDGDKVTWMYRGKKPIFIFDDGFYMLDEPNDFELRAVYHCANILAEHGFIEGYKKVVE